MFYWRLLGLLLVCGGGFFLSTAVDAQHTAVSHLAIVLHEYSFTTQQAGIGYLAIFI